MKTEELIGKLIRELTIELGEEGFKHYRQAPGSGYSGEVKLTGALAKMIECTLLRPEATYNQIERLCAEAKAHGLSGVVVNPSYVRLASRLLGGSGVKVCTVIGFPLGATTIQVKTAETKEAVENGADEVEMVVNVGALKSGFYNLVYQECKAVVAAATPALTTVTIESCYLTTEETIKACLLAKYAGADFVKTLTGFGPTKTTTEEISLMRKVVGDGMGIKAAGGIERYATAQALIKAGADRLVTTAGLALLEKER